jgi:hypothetical protein
MKTSHFEGGVALWAAGAAQGRDESTQCEPATSILTLAGHGWSARRIARQLDLNRETVGKYLRLARSKPAISTAGSAADSFSKPAIPTPGCWRTATPGRPSCCQPFAQHIEAAAAVGLSAQRIYQDLVSEHGFTGSYQAVKRFVRQWRQTQPTPFIRMEVEAGAEAQVCHRAD